MTENGLAQGTSIETRTFGANVHLLRSPQGTLLIDSGVPGPREKILAWAREAQVDALLLTHHHTDHVGGARQLWEALGLPIYAPALDLPFIIGEARRPPLLLPLFGLGDRIANAAPTLPRAAVTPVQAGDDVLGWEVVALPGHTGGQIGVRRGDILIAGDAIGARGGAATLPPGFLNEDTARAKRTVRTIADLGAREVRVGHGGVTSSKAAGELADKLGV